MLRIHLQLKRPEEDHALMTSGQEDHALMLSLPAVPCPMQHLTPQQLPRGGAWSAAADGHTLRALEAWCLDPMAKAAAPAPGSRGNGTAAAVPAAGRSTAAAATVPGGGVTPVLRTSGTATEAVCSSSRGRRRAGSAVSGSVASGCNAAAGAPTAEADGGSAGEAVYDEDGLRWVF